MIKEIDLILSAYGAAPHAATTIARRCCTDEPEDLAAWPALSTIVARLRARLSPARAVVLRVMAGGNPSRPDAVSAKRAA